MSKNIAIFSAKGGVGKTFVAVNLAISLAKAGKSTLLLDFDLLAGQDMARMLGILPHKSIFDLIPILDKDEAKEAIKSYVSRHKSKLDFLPAVIDSRQSPHIKPEIISRIFALTSDLYDYIIVDAGKALTESIVSVFNHANLILLVVTPDVLSVYQTTWTIDSLQALNFPVKMFKLIINRAESRGAATWQEVKSAINSDILGLIPSEGRTVGLSLNRGIPVVLDSPHSKVSDAFKTISKKLIEHNEFFLEHKLLEQLQVKKGTLPKAGDFWERFGMAATLVIEKETKEEDKAIKLKRRIHLRLIEEMDLKSVDLESLSIDTDRSRRLRERAEKAISNLLTEETGAFLSSPEVRQRLVKEIADEALGLGPLEDLLGDPDITDIMVNNKDEVYIERFGKVELTDKKFISNEQVRAVIERIIAPLGRRIDESTPMVDARLPDGSRVNAIIPPLSLTGPMLTIRKFGRERHTMNVLLNRFRSLNQDMVAFLDACIKSRRNIIISGGTGSGKTTLLNILSEFIPETERIITIEDAAELKLSQEHWGRLEYRPPNIEGKGEITIRDLFRNTLRMRPDRIIIGECRSIETLDMLQAMNTGHDGSMTTIHANSTTDVLARLDSMILMSGIELPMRAIREMIASAIDLIIHTARLSDGSRKVTQITEITGMLDETHINLKDIFLFKQTGIDNDGKVLGDFVSTGYIPTFFEELKVRGISLSEDIFRSKK